MSQTNSHQKRTILVVEDNPVNSRLLCRMLQRWDYETVLVEDGEAALQQTGSLDPDLILMDMNLPGIDGWEATRQLKQAELTRHIPVVAVSADAMPEHIQRGLDNGCVAYVTKPLDFRKLRELLETLISSAT